MLKFLLFIIELLGLSKNVNHNTSKSIIEFLKRFQIAFKR